MHGLRTARAIHPNLRARVVARGLRRRLFMWAVGLVPVVVVVASACARAERRAEPVSDGPPCTSARSSKLGTPFARLCPQDLPGVVSTSFWIAAAPLACPPGSHDNLLCAPVHALTAMDTVVDARTAMLVDPGLAHRICVLRYGGRLPTAAERAQAADALREVPQGGRPTARGCTRAAAAGARPSR